jgi:hypothetical protein
MWKETIFAYFKISDHLPGETAENAKDFGEASRPPEYESGMLTSTTLWTFKSNLS